MVSWPDHAVAFQLYDLDKTGDIQPGEVKRLLVALLHNNPDIALDQHVIGQIVDQVTPRAKHCITIEGLMCAAARRNTVPLSNMA